MNKKIINFILMGAIAVFTGACVQDMESTANSTSHNAGQDCLSSGCHNDGSKFLEVGGTVYNDAAGNGTAGSQGLSVILKDLSGNTVGTLPVDKSGNFYTNRGVSMPVKAEVSNANTMTGTVNYGGCNRSDCHTTNAGAAGRIF